MPGWNGLANARVTIFGDVYPVPPDNEAIARDIFRLKHTSATHSNQVPGPRKCVSALVTSHFNV